MLAIEILVMDAKIDALSALMQSGKDMQLILRCNAEIQKLKNQKSIIFKQTKR